MKTFYGCFMKESKSIMIPSLQRDYVQGERPDVIVPFVDSLLNSLKTEGEKLDLNYIYGSEKDDSFVPIDGQQRLITLWLLHIYLFAYQTERAASFPVALRFASREFANDFSESILVHLDCLVQNDNEGLKERIEHAPWFLNGWKYDRTVRNMLNTLDCISKKCSEPELCTHYDNISFSFLSMDEGLTDDIYVKMNGRGKPLTYFENLKSWMDERVSKLFGADSDFSKDWQDKMDNAWTDFFWQNRNRAHPEEIDESQTRFFYNLLRIFWTKKGKTGFVADNDKRKNACAVLNIDEPSDLESSIMGKISKTDDFTLPLYVLDNLDLFSREFFEWARDVLNGLACLYKSLNDEQVEFDFDTKETLTSKIFFSHKDRCLIAASSILDFLLYCNGASFHDWLRFTRNIVCNLDSNHNDVSSDNLESVLLGFEEMARQCTQESSVLLLLSKLKPDEMEEEDSLLGIPCSVLKEEKTKASLILADNRKWRGRIERLENNRYFAGQIKFVFDFLGAHPSAEAYDDYARLMNSLFSGNGKDNHYFSRKVNENLFSRALLCFTTDYGFGFVSEEYKQNWSFPKSSKYGDNTWKKYISDARIVGTEQRPHNDALKRLLDAMIENGEKEITDTALEKLISDRHESIKDWRRLFIDYPAVWEYMTEKYCRWYSNYHIGLVKSVNYGEGVSHAELRAYCLYLDFKEKHPEKNMSRWTFDFWEKGDTCLWFRKDIKDGYTVEMDVSFDVQNAESAESEDAYTIEILLTQGWEAVDKKISKKELRKHVTDDFKASEQGYRLKRLYSKKEIVKLINDMLKLSF